MRHSGHRTTLPHLATNDARAYTPLTTRRAPRFACAVSNSRAPGPRRGRARAPRWPSTSSAWHSSVTGRSTKQPAQPPHRPALESARAPARGSRSAAARPRAGPLAAPSRPSALPPGRRAPALASCSLLRFEPPVEECWCRRMSWLLICAGSRCQAELVVNGLGPVRRGRVALGWSVRVVRARTPSLISVRDPGLCLDRRHDSPRADAVTASAGESRFVPAGCSSISPRITALTRSLARSAAPGRRVLELRARRRRGRGTEPGLN